MNNKNLLIQSVLLFLLIAVALFPQQLRGELNDKFTFVFCTDIHVQPERNATRGFLQAIDSINKLNPAFVITGGDLIMDALATSYERADSLYDLYQEVIKNFNMPVYNTIGNHEIYGIYSKSGADPSHPEFGEKMYEKRLGKSYYTFNYGSWKFFVLNSIEDTKQNKYVGLVDSLQIEWIKDELKTTDKNTPIIISTHIPFITVFSQKYGGATVANDSGLVVVNSKDILELFKGYNLKLVLQGHLHIVEDIFIDGVRFITGGAVSGRWWTGPNMGFEEGFLLINVNGDNFDWKYIDYGWVIE